MHAAAVIGGRFADRIRARHVGLLITRDTSLLAQDGEHFCLLESVMDVLEGGCDCLGGLERK